MPVLRSIAEWNPASPTEMNILQHCRNAIRSLIPTALLILYGSRARGDARDDSDFNLLVLIDSSPNVFLEEKLRHYLLPIEIHTGAMLSVLVESRELWWSSLNQAKPWTMNIDRDGVVL